MTEFCQTHGIEHDICGKVIVATKVEEIPLLENLYKRGLDNGLSIYRIGPEELKEIQNFSKKKLPSMPDDLLKYLNSFRKVSISS